MEKRALYMSDNHRDWIQIAEELRDIEGISPKYWLGSPNRESELKKKFPDIIFHSRRRALRGLPSKDIHRSIERSVAIDKDVLEQYRKHTYTVFRAMDRVDPKYSFNYDERVTYYHKLLNYWKNVFDEYGVSLVIFPGSPPHAYSNLINAICIEEDIEKIILQSTKIPNTWFVRSEIHEKPHFLSSSNISVDKYTLSEATSQYYQDQIKTGKRHFTPTDKGYFEFFPDLVQYPNYVKKLFGKANSYYKKPHKQMKKEDVTWVEYIIHKYRTGIRKKRLKRHYEDLTEHPKFNSNYIFVPLHYQPERTTVPEGDVYSTQNMFIKLLRDVLPNEHYIFIKEHPVQFHTFKKGEHSRYKYHYDDLNSLDNVILVDLDIDVNNLIDNSMAVATLTGTAAWEAAFRDTPSLMFGTAWYAGCPGIYDVKNKSDVANAIKEIINEPRVDISDVKEYMKVMEKYGFQSYATSAEFDREIPAKDAVKNTAVAISDYLQKYDV